MFILTLSRLLSSLAAAFRLTLRSTLTCTLFSSTFSARMTEIVNRRHLERICSARPKLVAWCQEMGLLPASRLCPTHGEEMKMYASHGYGRFRCTKNNCGMSIQLMKGTIFKGAKLDPDTILSIFYR
jgi:hypothetical protein